MRSNHDSPARILIANETLVPVMDAGTGHLALQTGALPQVRAQSQVSLCAM